MTGKATRAKNSAGKNDRQNRLDAAAKDDYVPPLQPAQVREYDALVSPEATFEALFGNVDQTNKYGPKNDPRRKIILLAWLSAGWSRGRACDEARVSTRCLERWEHDDEDFKALVKEAIERGTDLIEDVAKYRSTKGIVKPVYQGGLLVGYQSEVSDTLMVQTLAGRRPNKYGKQKIEHTGADGTPLKVEIEFVAPTKKAET